MKTSMRSAIKNPPVESCYAFVSKYTTKSSKKYSLRTQFLIRFPEFLLLVSPAAGGVPGPAGPVRHHRRAVEQGSILLTSNRAPYHWAQDYRGEATVVYGHTPVPEAEWLNRTIDIDTGCVFGGALTAFRYLERELVSVPAEQMYAEPVRPFLAEQTPAFTAQQQVDDMLDMIDVIGKRIVNPRLRSNITIREGNAAAALEVMSRFAVNPKWLIYLLPTMSPTETSREPDLLDHPAETFAYYRASGVGQVICEEKHMGSRAMVIICKNTDIARERFGVLGEDIGVCYTRTGRRFFEDVTLEAKFLMHIRDAVQEAGICEALETGWICLDCELMPWSAKALVLAQPSAPGLPTLRNAPLEALEVADLRAQATGSQVVYITAHAELNRFAPLFSVIHLGEGGGYDGRLEVREIYELDLPRGTELVVLSGCETASGGGGEDFGLLTRAFFAAGTPRVVASLWSVDDAATADLLTAFIAERATHANAADALRVAMLTAREQYPEPYYWASFVLSGLP
jgi:hypothetical protein